jgi:hypothetical protein
VLLRTGARCYDAHSNAEDVPARAGTAAVATALSTSRKRLAWHLYCMHDIAATLYRGAGVVHMPVMLDACFEPCYTPLWYGIRNISLDCLPACSANCAPVAHESGTRFM